MAPYRRRRERRSWPSVPSGDPTHANSNNHALLRPHRGGIESVETEQARRLVQAGHEVTVVMSKLAGDECFSSREGIDVHRVAALNFLERR